MIVNEKFVVRRNESEALRKSESVQKLPKKKSKFVDDVFAANTVVYVRFLRNNGLNSCQLIFGRSKIFPQDTSVPRGEMMASLLTATNGHVVNLALVQAVYV